MNEIHLQGPNGHRISLRVVGYQYESINDSEDDDWLVVEGHVARGPLTWKFRTPCLTVTEVMALGAWFQQLLDVDDAVPETHEFIEPNLSFECSRANRELLRVYFRLEARPTQKAPDEDRMADDLWIEVDASAPALRRAAVVLDEVVVAFPSRSAASGDAG